MSGKPPPPEPTSGISGATGGAGCVGGVGVSFFSTGVVTLGGSGVIGGTGTGSSIGGSGIPISSAIYVPASFCSFAYVSVKVTIGDGAASNASAVSNDVIGNVTHCVNGRAVIPDGW